MKLLSDVSLPVIRNTSPITVDPITGVGYTNPQDYAPKWADETETIILRRDPNTGEMYEGGSRSGVTVEEPILPDNGIQTHDDRKPLINESNLPNQSIVSNSAPESSLLKPLLIAGAVFAALTLLKD